MFSLPHYYFVLAWLQHQPSPILSVLAPLFIAIRKTLFRALGVAVMFGWGVVRTQLPPNARNLVITGSSVYLGLVLFIEISFYGRSILNPTFTLNLLHATLITAIVDGVCALHL